MGLDEGIGGGWYETGDRQELRETREIREFSELAERETDYECIKEICVEQVDSLEGLGEEPVLVTGSPFEMAEELDCRQGDNKFQAASDCGLVSCSNFLKICGVEADEDEIVEFALEQNLCGHSPFQSPQEWGGTDDRCLETILESYGVESSVYYPGELRGSIEGIADAVEEGHAAMIGVNAGYLWNEPGAVGDGCANHQITVTGTVRDSSGELAALTICDSGRHLDSDSCRVVPVAELESCYANVSGASVILSDQAVR